MSIQEQNKKSFLYKYIKFHLFRSSFFLAIILSFLNNVLCNDNSSKNRTKTIIILILLVVAFIIILILVILFIVCICCKKRQENRNNYLEGSNALEIGNQKEVDLRERITNEGIQALSNYLKNELFSDIYTKKYELFTNKCPICLENFIENKSTIILGGCLHIFHEKCLSILAEKIDLNKSIFSQFTCPTCRNNLLDGIDKIKNCIDIDPNFFDDIYKNKKITKMKHVKKIIEKMLNENKNKKTEIREENSKEKFSNMEENFTNKKQENENDNDYKDISFDNIVIPIKKSNIKKSNSHEIKNNENEIINNNDNPV